MASADSHLIFGLRGSQGVQLLHTAPKEEPVEWFKKVPVDSRFAVFSPKGRYFVFQTPTGVQLADMNVKEILDLGPQTALVRDAAFSPQESFMVLWDAPSKKEDNSCTLYDLRSRTLTACYSQAETTWKIRWSKDEQLFFLMGKDQYYVFENMKFDVPAQNPKSQFVGEISVSPGPKPHHVIMFHPFKNSPSFVRLYQYPRVDEQTMAIAARCVMKEDSVVFKWNSKGSHVLFLASVDLAADSYYGAGNLYLMNTKGDSILIRLDQEGPIHAWEWNPHGDNFCAIYGFMPGKTCIFDKKGDLVHTFGSSQYRNGVLFNPYGNLLCLSGSGNIRGNYDIWDMKTMRKVTSQDAEYATHIEWSPNGAMLLIATLSPRLKVNNRYQVWTYNGQKLIDTPYQGELFQALWRPLPPDNFTPPDPSQELGKNFPTNEVAKPAAYVPPALRNRPGIVGLPPPMAATALFASHQQQQQQPFRPVQQANKPAFPVGLGPEGDAKAKPKKKKKAKADGPVKSEQNGRSSESVSEPQTNESVKSSEGGAGAVPQPNGAPRQPRPSPKKPNNSNGAGKTDAAGTDGKMKTPKKQQPSLKPVVVAPSPEPPSEDDGPEPLMSTGDPEKDKKIQKLNKKISEINSLKQEQASGKTLEKNQLDKIKKMDSVMRELELLQLSSIIRKK